MIVDVELNSNKQTKISVGVTIFDIFRALTYLLHHNYPVEKALHFQS